jgi:hypothetical protein
VHNWIVWRLEYEVGVMTKELQLSRSIKSTAVSNVIWGYIMKQIAVIYMHDMVLYMKGKAVKTKQVNGI